MKPKKPNQKGKKVVALLLLAFLCIGSAELIACRIADPVLFEKLTAPVVRAFHTAKEAAARAVSSCTAFVSHIFSSFTSWLKELAAPPENDNAETEQSQLASDPTIVDTEPVTDPLITELQTVGEQAILTGGPVQIVYYNQGEDPWKDMPYGTDHIGGYGCGPTVTAMIVSSITDEQIDPAAMAQWAVERHHWAAGSGSYHSIVKDAAEFYGLQCESLTDRTPEGLRSALLSGKLLVALMRQGHFTNNGHFIILHGATLSGEILVADPNSLERSLTAWDPQLILDELSKNAVSGGPIWVISSPVS